MNILLISGSPRKNGNTNTIVQQIAEKLKANHAVEVCRIPDYQINSCLGCNHCQSVLDEPGCVQKDDVTRLLEKVMDADMVLYALAVVMSSAIYFQKYTILLQTSVSKAELYISNSTLYQGSSPPFLR